METARHREARTSSAAADGVDPRRHGRSAGLCLLVLLILLAGAFTGSARAEFGFKALSLTFNGASTPSIAPAGSHPSTLTATVDFNTTLNAAFKEIPDGHIRNLRLRLPPGLLGAPAALVQCRYADFVGHRCPPASLLGTGVAYVAPGHSEERAFTLYNLVPQPDNAVEVGVDGSSVQKALQFGIAPDPPYGLVASFGDLPVVDPPIYGARFTVDGVPDGTPFLTLPRTCGDPLRTEFEAETWEEPGVWTTGSVLAEDELHLGQPLMLSDCASLPFAPSFALTTSPPTEGAPAGLDFHLRAPNLGYQDPSGQAEADLRRIRLTLPEGMALNPAVADGLVGCTPAEYARESTEAPPGSGCPEAANVGSATATTPLLQGAVPGSVYVAQPDDPATAEPGAENPFDSRYALYVIFKDPDRGILLKEAAKLEADPESGRLTVSVEDIPQLPVSAVDLHFRQGPRGPLTIPCGEQSFDYLLTPSDGSNPLAAQRSFDSGRPCGSPGFHPRLSSGSAEARAGTFSPFLLELSRTDEEEQLDGFSLTFPAGLTAAFGSVPLCPQALLRAVACPSASLVGSATLAAGSGTAPLLLPQQGGPAGSVYLAGPYRGAPYSLLIVVRAQAGPLDLGLVAIQAAVEIDPVSAQATISAPGLPRILAGVPVAYRAVRITLDRPGFVRNPTSCEPMQITALVSSTGGAVASLANHFQVAGCASIGFKPRLSLGLSGGLGRNAHPAITADLTPRAGDAGIAGMSFTLPAGELVDTRRLRALCGDQLSPESCPRNSRLGVVHLRSPLFDRPLEGPIYLRTSTDGFPDLLADLRADQLQILLRGHTAAPRGRLRISFPALPDIPFSSASITLPGGRNGILVNSEALCGQARRAAVRLIAHNGMQRLFRPKLSLRGHC